MKGLKQELLEEQRLKIKEIEEENILIIEGLKNEYEERI